VAHAIDEQYLPDSAGAPIPRTAAGRLLAAADKLDHLVTAFNLGHAPTGSRDPYALRRAAIGLIRLAIEGDVPVRRDRLGAAQEFVEDRLEGLLDVPVEFVRAARASATPDLGGVARLAKSLHAAESTPEFASVYEAFDRAQRLAGKQSDAAPAVDEDAFEHDTERELYSALRGRHLDPDEFDEALRQAAEISPLVSRFFDDVMVMTDDARVRANRLRLLLEVRDALGRLGDLSLIPR
jgi:glycyl-tRNA synthetase beta chain